MEHNTRDPADATTQRPMVIAEELRNARSKMNKETGLAPDS